MPEPGMEHAFSRDAEGRTTACVVSSPIILPDGRYVTKMKDVEQASYDYNKHYCEAAPIAMVPEALRTGGMR